MSFGWPAFGCAMTGSGVVALVALDGLARALHVHARAAIERDDVGAVLLHERRGALGIDAHHGAERRAVERDVVGHRTDDARRRRPLRAAMPEAQLLERRLRFDDDRVGAGVDQGLRLLGERVAHLRPR